MACKIPFLYWIGRTRSSGLSALANSCNLLFHPPSLIMADADVDDQAGILLCRERSCHSYVLQLFVEHDTRLYRNLLKKTLEQWLNILHANIIASKLSFMIIHGKVRFFRCPKKNGPIGHFQAISSYAQWLLNSLSEHREREEVLSKEITAVREASGIKPLENLRFSLGVSISPSQDVRFPGDQTRMTNDMKKSWGFKTITPPQGSPQFEVPMRKNMFWGIAGLFVIVFSFFLYWVTLFEMSLGQQDANRLVTSDIFRSGYALTMIVVLW